MALQTKGKVGMNKREAASIAFLMASVPICLAYLPSGLPESAAEVSKEAPQWAQDEGAFDNISQSPFNDFFLKNNPQLKSFTREKFFPFIDEFGQFIHKDWPDKLKGESDFKKRYDQETLWLGAHKRSPIGLDEFGGTICALNFGNSRHFRIVEAGNRYFFATPKGNIFWSYGINAVAQSSGTRISNRRSYFSGNAVEEPRYQSKLPYDRRKSIFFNFEERNKNLKYADKKSYFKRVKERLLSWGMNTIGNWSNAEFIQEAKMPFVVTAEIAKTRYISYEKSAGRNLGANVPDYFDDKFPDGQLAAYQAVQREITSPYCIGVFSGYKLGWQYNGADIAAQTLASPPGQPAKIFFAGMLKDKYGPISALNKSWGSDYRNWEDFLERSSMPPKTAEGLIDVREFTGAYYERFFSVCARALKRVDADVLYLGCRFQEYPKDARLLCTAAKYADVVSLVCYSLKPEDLKLPKNCPRRPILACEFNFCATDRGVFGGGFNPVQTTALQCDMFADYARRTMANPGVIGLHWMRYSDPPTSGKHNGENTASGFVDICDTPIYPLCEISSKLGAEVLKTQKIK